MKRYIAIFENLVTDDVIMQRIDADSMEQADDIAYEFSKGTGLSEGDYDLYIDVFDAENK